MDWQHLYESKIVDAPEAMSKIMRGSRVFIGTGCGEPQHLIHAMVAGPEFAGYYGLSDAVFHPC